MTISRPAQLVPVCGVPGCPERGTPRHAANGGPAVTLRAAARRLTQHPAGVGYHIPDAIFAAAQHLTGSPRPYDLVEANTKIMGGYLHEQAGPACEMTGGELIRRYGLFAPTDVIMKALYAAAAQYGGCDFGP
ncbi:hypothetical protein GA0074696_2206 [Micromonospora purpureochromogenes]|uniref:Uncharacterized protein n=1 Tax=Micromonospora purpureochromogenes TaxID=47872 RepID=A0A1C4WXW8_9ACTN|nr:hypothetical protein [Micromonospora purpureochromogenes]SCF01107.1 hypothetical protein GA0074696_2206 [Micromonospora purpureochromogenes]